MSAEARELLLRQAVVEIAARCPRVVKSCYWAGTSAISLEELRHRESFDLDGDRFVRRRAVHFAAHGFFRLDGVREARSRHASTDF
jgi:hypothetical protein